MKPINDKPYSFENSRQKSNIFIFYDFETTQNTKIDENTFLHKVNFCVAQKVCNHCMNETFDDENICGYCLGGCSEIFDNGDETLNNFIDFVLDTEELPNIAKVTVIAHNSKSFDWEFVLNNIVSNARVVKEPQVILSGSKIMVLRIGRISFIDSLNFFNMKLSSLPKAFGLKNNIVKGTFPFHFNTIENQNYVGPLPDKKFYGSETMSVNDKKKFDEFQYNFLYCSTPTHRSFVPKNYKVSVHIRHSLYSNKRSCLCHSTKLSPLDYQDIHTVLIELELLCKLL